MLIIKVALVIRRLYIIVEAYETLQESGLLNQDTLRDILWKEFILMLFIFII